MNTGVHTDCGTLCLSSAPSERNSLQDRGDHRGNPPSAPPSPVLQRQSDPPLQPPGGRGLRHSAGRNHNHHQKWTFVKYYRPVGAKDSVDLIAVIMRALLENMTFYDLMTETICFRWEEKRKAACVLYTIWIIVFSCVCVCVLGGRWVMAA